MRTRRSTQTFVVRLRAGPKVDAIRALRAALKVLGRWFGLRAISVPGGKRKIKISERNRRKDFS
jgi:hypothetical protein